MFLDGRRREMRSCTSKGSKEKKFKTALSRRNRQLTPLAHWHSKPLSEPELSEMATESRLVCHLGSWPLPNGAHPHGLRKWRCALLPRRLLHFAATPENHALQPPLDRDSDRKRATERCGRCPSLLTQEVIMHAECCRNTSTCRLQVGPDLSRDLLGCGWWSDSCRRVFCFVLRGGCRPERCHDFVIAPLPLEPGFGVVFRQVFCSEFGPCPGEYNLLFRHVFF